MGRSGHRAHVYMPPRHLIVFATTVYTTPDDLPTTVGPGPVEDAFHAACGDETHMIPLVRGAAPSDHRTRAHRAARLEHTTSS